MSLGTISFTVGRRLDQGSFSWFRKQEKEYSESWQRQLMRMESRLL